MSERKSNEDFYIQINCKSLFGIHLILNLMLTSNLFLANKYRPKIVLKNSNVINEL
jgi:hypothetical protein